MSFAPPPPSPPPIIEMRVVYKVPGMDQVQVRRNVVYRTVGETRLELDVYGPSAPAGAARRPVVLLVHGGPVPAGARPKDWGMFVSYGQMLAASGFTAVTFNHRFYGAPGVSCPTPRATSPRRSRMCASARTSSASTRSGSRCGPSPGAVRS